ncbi:MAG: metalloregulator ArsR/SmtB family transcription factor [Chloroflexi bacterium]|nr:metalloregulator ArsR/SmtB family transcription factor [Chloroflexota bacterium]
MVTTSTDERTQELRAAQADLLAKFFRALGDPTRVRILKILLEDGPRSVGELVEETGGSQSRVSTHLGCLKWCGLVASVRDGKRVIYSIGDDRVAGLLRGGEQVLADNAEQVIACQTIV